MSDNAKVTYTTNNSNGPYAVPFPYRAQEDVHFIVDGSETTEGITWLSATSVSVLMASGHSLEIIRRTKDDVMEATIQSGSVNPPDLNNNFRQLLYLLQEVLDTNGRVLHAPDTDPLIGLIPGLAARKNGGLGSILGFSGATGDPQLSTIGLATLEALFNNSTIVSQASGLVQLYDGGYLPDAATPKDGIADATTYISAWLSSSPVILWLPEGRYSVDHIDISILTSKIIRGPGVFVQRDKTKLISTYNEWIKITAGVSGLTFMFDGPGFDMQMVAGSAPYYDRQGITGSGYYTGSALVSAMNYVGVRTIGFAKAGCKNTTWTNPARCMIVQGNSNSDRSSAFYYGNAIDGKASIVNEGFGAYWCDGVKFDKNVCRGLSWNETTDQVNWQVLSQAAFFAQYSSDISCTDNIVRGMQIVFQAGLQAYVETQAESAVEISGNWIFEPPADTAAYGFNGVNIHDNSVIKSGDWGITFDFSTYVKVHDNKIDGVSVSAIGGGGTTFGPISIQGNYINNVAQCYRSVNITGITRSGTTATAATASPHGYTVGARTLISGADQSDYNIEATVTAVPDATHFSYTVSGSPVTPATCASDFAKGGCLSSQIGTFAGNFAVSPGGCGVKLDIESPSTCPPRNITVANNTFMIGNPVPARHGFAIFIAATDDNTTVTDVAPSLPNRLSGSGIIKDNVVEANDNYPQWLIYAYSSMVKMSSTAAVTFTRGEKVTGTGGSARFIDKFGLYLLLVDQVGPFSGSVTLTGAISGATDTTDASPQNLGTGYIVRDNSDLMSRNNNVAIT